MAVVSVGEIWSGRRGKTTREWANEYDRVFMVETNSATDSAQTVTGAGAIALGLPKRGDVHNEDTLAACIDVSASNSSDDPREWHVTCSYSTDLSSFSTDPPANAKARGEAMSSLGAGIEALDRVAPEGKRVDRRAVFEAHNIPLEDAPTFVAPAAPAAPPAPQEPPAP
jgi:hypothetical protein